MKKKLLFIGLFSVLIWSCGKDDGPTPPKNSAPEMEAQTFSANENIDHTVVIGTVKATDKDKDALTFSIKTNDGNLFEITTEGELSLGAGKTLDFNEAASHKITVEVSDSEEETTAEITINVTNVNTAPEFGEEAYKFNDVAEDTDDEKAIGTVTATDADGDALTYGLAQNDNDLFEISETGDISLADGKKLDYETAVEHMIIVEVTDGNSAPVTVEVTISVANVVESMSEDPASFVTTWNIALDGQELEIGIDKESIYEFTIDWGDGTKENLSFSNKSSFSHVYQTAGTYTVAIQEGFPAIRMVEANVVSKQALASIDQWGTISWSTFNNAFSECKNMENNTTDTPELANVMDMSYMFYNADSFSGDLSGWDVSSVTNMKWMFLSADSFNGDISNWNTSNVTNMSRMFYKAESFNGNIGDWDTGNVVNMSRMFWDAPLFNQNLGTWNIGSVTDMTAMFSFSGLSTQNFTATLVGWEAADNTPNDIILAAEGIYLCDPEGAPAYDSLTNGHNWTIDFAGFINCE